MKAMGVAAGMMCLIAGGAFGDTRGGRHADVVLGFGILHQDGGTNGHGAARLGLSSKTRTQHLRLDLDAAHLTRIGSYGSARLRYGREAKRSRFMTEFRYGRRPAGAIVFQPIGMDGFADIIGSNTAEKSGSARVGFESGLGGPIGLKLDLGHRYREIDDALGSRQTGRRNAADLALRFDLSRRSSVAIGAGVEQFSASGATVRGQDARNLFFDVTHRPNTRLKADARLGWRKVGAFSGSEWRLGLALERKESVIFGRVGERMTSSGRLGEVTIGGSRDTPVARLSYDIGLAKLAGQSVEITGHMRYRHELPKGKLAVDFSRGYAGSDLAIGLRLVSRASLRLERKIGALGNLDVQFEMAQSDANQALNSQKLRQIRVAYTHDLTADWGLAGGAQRKVSRQGDAGRQVRNGVFLRLERRFSGGF